MSAARRCAEATQLVVGRGWSTVCIALAVLSTRRAATGFFQLSARSRQIASPCSPNFMVSHRPHIPIPSAHPLTGRTSPPYQGRLAQLVWQAGHHRSTITGPRLRPTRASCDERFCMGNLRVGVALDMSVCFNRLWAPAAPRPRRKSATIMTSALSARSCSATPWVLPREMRSRPLLRGQKARLT